ncbi:MAG: outer membrane protein assembly factor BamA [Phycisphaera sp.]|nr:outer membrane protein assembly factor BamA [Phycisphaera sp.]
MFNWRNRGIGSFFLAATLLIGVAGIDAAWGQTDVANRPVSEVRVEGTKQVSEQLVRNQITLEPGNPYNPDIVARDINNITRLGRFATVRVRVDPKPDGSIVVTYVVDEQKLLSDVQVVGNKAISDQEVMSKVLLRAGDPQDTFLIDRARMAVRDYYREKGYFLADVDVDQQTLDDNGILILRVREGPRIRVREIAWEGNETFKDKEIASKIRTQRYVFIFSKGILSKDALDKDVARVRDFYEQRGYLDVRVGRRIDLAEDQKDAKITFVIDEGRQYTVASMEIEGNSVYSSEQIARAMDLKVGDVFSLTRLRQTDDSVKALYDKLGMLESHVTVQRVFHPTDPTVDLKVKITESRRAVVGNVVIRGNELTQDKVVRRQIRGIEPGRAWDGTGIPESEQNIRETRLFREAKVTVMGEPDDETRDALVEVKEANTGSVSFGAAVSSDAGVFGAIDLTQRNFDIADLPESWGEFFTGRAFRGAGQFFQIALQPGDQFQRYQVQFREPFMFDTDYFLDTNLFYFTRQRENWDEERIGATLGVGKRFGDVWSASIRSRVEQVSVTGVEKDAPIDAKAIEDENNLITGLGFSVTRSTVDSRLFPTVGSRLIAGIEQAGALGGDASFTRFNFEHNAFFTIDEDFFGRKTVLSLRTEMGYILNNATRSVDDTNSVSHKISDVPIYERYYAGGHRNFRGFDFRGVGPRGIQYNTGKLGNDPIGGEWMFLLGLEYNYPIYEDVLRGVLFVDTGTVQEDFGFDQYRVSVGGGIRLKLPFFGAAPFAFDLAYPLVKQEGDNTQFFSFDIALPF